MRLAYSILLALVAVLMLESCHQAPLEPDNCLNITFTQNGVTRYFECGVEIFHPKIEGRQ